MNKLAIATLPTMALCGAIFAGSSVLAESTGVLANLPSELALDIKESAYMTNESEGTVDKAAKSAVEAALATAGVDITGNTLNVYCGFGERAMYNCSAYLLGETGQDVGSADFTIKYSNTDSLSEAERAAIKSKLNLGSFVGENNDPTYMYIMHEPGSSFYTPGETICTDHTCASRPAEFSEEFYKEEKATLTSKLSKRAGESMNFYFGTIYAGIAIPEGFETAALAEVYAVVDDALVDCGAIASLHGYGYELSDGSVVTYQDLNPEGTSYIAMAAKLAEEGRGEVLGAYELQLVGSHTGNITAIFNVGTEYDGRTVVILHKKSDNTYEEFEKTVAGGKVSVEVSSLSPFMVALKDGAVKSPDSGAASKSDNSGVTAGVLTTIVSAVMALGVVAGIKKFAKAEK